MNNPHNLPWRVEKNIHNEGCRIYDCQGYFVADFIPEHYAKFIVEKVNGLTVPDELLDFMGVSQLASLDRTNSR